MLYLTHKKLCETSLLDYTKHSQYASRGDNEAELVETLDEELEILPPYLDYIWFLYS